MPFPFALAHLGAKPLEPFGKGSNALKAGTPDAGPEGPTVSGALTPAQPSVQPPAGVERKRPYTRGGRGKARLLRVNGPAWSAPGSARQAVPPTRPLRGSACRRGRWQRGLCAASLSRRAAPPYSGSGASAGIPGRFARGRVRL